MTRSFPATSCAAASRTRVLPSISGRSYRSSTMLTSSLTPSALFFENRRAELLRRQSRKQENGKHEGYRQGDEQDDQSAENRHPVARGGWPDDVPFEQEIGVFAVSLVDEIEQITDDRNRPDKEIDS